MIKSVCLERQTIDSIRHYVTPDGTFPSVTSVIGITTDGEFLKEWAGRIGSDNAQKITELSAYRGTIVHNLAEQYLKKEIIITEGIYKPYVDMYERLIPFLNKMQPEYVEHTVYSKKMGVAGSMDVAGLYDSVNSIIDFKTSNYEKNEEWLDNYFHQTSFYSYMLEELYGYRAEQLVVLISTHYNGVQEIIRNRKSYRGALKRIIKEYREFLLSKDI